MIIGLVILLLIIVFACWYIYKTNKKRKYWREIEEATKKQIEDERRREKELEKKAKDQELKEKYGDRSAGVNYPELKIGIYNCSRTIIINGKVFSFDEITGCTIIEEKKVIPGQTTTTYTTKTSGSSMIGRTLVGAVVAGPLGAAIGGVTAKRDTTQYTHISPDRVEYNYYVTIGINRKDTRDIVYNTYIKIKAERVKKIIDRILLNKECMTEATPRQHLKE